MAAIKAAYPDRDVYAGSVEQGLKEPCFSVKCIRPSQRQVVGRRYFRRNLIRIYYFPTPGGDAWSEINAVFDTLFEALELITCDGDLVRGTDMGTEISDDVGVFLVNYNYFLHRGAEDEPDMDDLTIEGL